MYPRRTWLLLWGVGRGVETMELTDRGSVVLTSMSKREPWDGRDAIWN